MRIICIKDIRRIDGSKGFYLSLEDNKDNKDSEATPIEEFSKEDFASLCETYKPCVLDERLYSFAVNYGWLDKQPEVYNRKLPPKGFYNATIIGDLFDVDCVKVGAIVNLLDIKNSDDCSMQNLKGKNYTQYFYNISAVLKIGKYIGFFSTVEPSKEELEEVLNCLAKIRYCGSKPNKKEALWLDSWNNKYLQKK